MAEWEGKGETAEGGKRSEQVSKELAVKGREEKRDERNEDGRNDGENPF